MTEPDEDRDGLGHDDKNLIVDTLFDVALDSSRYETLLDVWEERIAPLRGREGDAADEFRDAILEGHVARAGQVLDREPKAPLSDPIGHLMSSLLPTAAVVINRNGVIAHANAAAKAVFSAAAGQGISELPFDEMQTKELLDAVGSIVAAKVSERYIRCISEDNGRLVVFRLSTMDAAQYGAGLVLAVSTELAWPESLSHTIRDAFQLTMAEVDIVRALVEGWSVNQIATARNRSVETVRTQVRSILSKTETRTQSELIRIALNLMDVVGGERRASGLKVTGDGTNRLAPIPFQTLWRPDGRSVDYVVLGDEQGRAIMCLPSDFGLIRWTATAERLLAAQGLRVIVPIRPGFGESSKLLKGQDRVHAVVDDIAALMDHLQLERAPMITLRQDGFWAYQFDKAHPGRLTAIIMGGPGLPLFTRDQYQRMDKWLRFIRANARYAPKILPFLVKAGFSLSRRIGKRGFLQAVYGNSPGDVAIYEDQEVFEALVTGSEVISSENVSAHDAFAEECILENYDWRELVHACTLPQVCFAGLNDQSMPPATLEEMKQEFPNIAFIEDETAGELVFFKRWPDILESALKHMG